MICLIALVVFAILGIFSASYRSLAAEAFDCVFRRVTFRKCRSGLDVRVKGQIIGKVMRRSPGAARFVSKNFEILSWTFTILMISSTAYSAYSGYNYIRYGNCNGPGEQGFCVFDPSTYNHQETCSVPQAARVQDPKLITKPSVSGLPSLGPADAPVQIIEVGCFQCNYTRQAAPVVKQIVDEYASKGKIHFVFKPFPLYSGHAYSKESVEALWCADAQGRYWEYYWQLFDAHTAQQECNYQLFDECAKAVLLDQQKFDSCLYNHTYAARVDKDYQESISAGVYGTPTFFINNRTAIVGPLKYKEFKAIIEDELRKQKSN